MPSIPSGDKSKIYKKGDRVFARIKGFSPWPARIDGIATANKNPKGVRYHVLFYGTYETGVCYNECIYDFEKFKVRFGKRKVRKFDEAMHEIVHKPDIIPPSSTATANGHKDDDDDGPTAEKRSKPSTSNVLKVSLFKSPKQKPEQPEASTSGVADKEKSTVAEPPVALVELSINEMQQLIDLPTVPESLKKKLQDVINSHNKTSGDDDKESNRMCITYNSTDEIEKMYQNINDDTSIDLNKINDLLNSIEKLQDVAILKDKSILLKLIHKITTYEFPNIDHDNVAATKDKAKSVMRKLDSLFDQDVPSSSDSGDEKSKDVEMEDYDHESDDDGDKTTDKNEEIAEDK